MSAVILPLTASKRSLQCRVLTTELAERLQKINALTRRLRAVAVRVMATDPLGSTPTLRISAEDAKRLTVFSHEWRGLVWSTQGTRTTYSARLDGCLITWVTPLKRQ